MCSTLFQGLGQIIAHSCYVPPSNPTREHESSGVGWHETRHCASGRRASAEKHIALKTLLLLADHQALWLARSAPGRSAGSAVCAGPQTTRLAVVQRSRLLSWISGTGSVGISDLGSSRQAARHRQEAFRLRHTDCAVVAGTSVP